MHFKHILLASSLALWSSPVVAILGDMNGLGSLDSSRLLVKRVEKVTPTSTPSSSGPLAGLEDLLRVREHPEEPTPSATPSSSSDPLSGLEDLLRVREHPEEPTPTATPSSSSDPLAGLENLLRVREDSEGSGYQGPSTFEKRLAPTKAA